MASILLTLWLFVVDLFKSRSWLEAENLFLRHQLNIALRRAPSHVRLSGGDRALLVLMTKLWPNLVGMARLFSRRLFFDGTVRVLGCFGGGSLETGQGGRKSIGACVT